MLSSEVIKKEYDEILQQLSNPELISDWERFDKLQKRKNYLEKIIEKEREMKSIKNKIEENKLIISAKEDKELVALAETENTQFQERKKTLEKEMKNLLRESDKTGEPQPVVYEANASSQSSFPPRGKSIIVEIRAGAGGQEACLFAGDLFRMYSKYGQSQGWQQKILDSHPTELGGFKEIIFELKNGDVFSKMKYEGGVHRVQRIPETEKGGRIHTSTSSVAILQKPKGAQIKIKPEDLRIDFYKASGPGGQYVNKRMTAVRITHLPSGLVVTSQTERNQLQNKENALSILEAKLLERKEIEELEKLGDRRKTQIGRAQRAEKIRTYNFPQDRMTDHRIKKSWHNIEKIMAGNLDKIISALTKTGI
jgi:peptide chain release factor 1